MNKLTEINQIASQQPEAKILFDSAVHVKLSPHTMPFTAWGVWFGAGGLYVLDGGGEWHGPLLESQVNSEFMINSLYQRIKVLQLKSSVLIAHHDEEVNATIIQ